MAIDISSGALTALVGLFGILIGTLIGPYVNHKLNLKNTRKDLIFKKKLEYFENIAENLEQNLRLYKNSISKAENSKNKFNDILNELKEKRKNYLILASPLYFNVSNLSERIMDFVEAEKVIFEYFPKLKNKKQKDIIVKDLKDKLKELIILRDKILFEMRRELYKDK